jgi:YegS/Rv2252/BmrU family lipid kinase
VKVAIILNSISLFRDDFYRKYLPLIQAAIDVELFETRSENDAVSLAQMAVANRFEIIAAAGGDGTIHQVVNGMLAAPASVENSPALALLPLGSGNDFVRSFSIDQSPEGFLNRLRAMNASEIDVGEVLFSVSRPETGVTSIQDKRYFLNVVDVGMGPPVVRGVLDGGRPLGSSVAYYTSILRTFFTYRPLPLHAKSANWEWKSDMRTFAIANAKYFGNGLCIAPEAKLDDGILNVFACGPVSVVDFIIQSVPLKQGRKVRHPQVFYFSTTGIELSSSEAVELEADGEIIGWLPATVGLSHKKIRILV